MLYRFIIIAVRSVCALFSCSSPFREPNLTPYARRRPPSGRRRRRFPRDRHGRNGNTPTRGTTGHGPRRKRRRPLSRGSILGGRVEVAADRPVGFGSWRGATVPSRPVGVLGRATQKRYRRTEIERRVRKKNANICDGYVGTLA